MSKSDCRYASQIFKSIRRLNRSIKTTTKRISRVSRQKDKAVGFWSRGLGDVQEKIKEINDAISSKISWRIDAINNYHDSMIKKVNEQYAPIIELANKYCLEEQTKFDNAIAFPLLRIQNTSNYINKLMQLRDAERDPSAKARYEGQIRETQKILNDMQKQVDGSRDILDKKLQSCSGSNARSREFEKNQAVAYWEKRRQESLEDAKKQSMGSANSTKLEDLEKEKENIVEQLNKISSDYDYNIQQLQDNLKGYIIMRDNLSKAISKISGDCDTYKECSPLNSNFEKCPEGFQWVVEYDPCPYFDCQPVDS